MKRGGGKDVGGGVPAGAGGEGLPEWIDALPDGSVRLRLRVQPNAKRPTVRSPVDGRLGISVSAPPVEGKANARLRRFLASILGVSKSSVTVVRGEGSKLKTVVVRGVSPRRLVHSLHSAAEGRGSGTLSP